MNLGKSKHPYSSVMWIAPPFSLLYLCVTSHEPEPSGTATTMSYFHQFPKTLLVLYPHVLFGRSSKY